jgi:hypothetical protein
MNEEQGLMSFIDFKNDEFVYEIQFITVPTSRLVLDKEDMIHLIQELFGNNGILSVSCDTIQTNEIKRKKIRFIVIMSSRKLKLNFSTIKNITSLISNGFALNGYNIFREKILFPVKKKNFTGNFKTKQGYLEMHTPSFNNIKNIDNNYLVKKINNIFEIRLSIYEEKNDGVLKYVWHDSNPMEDFII